MSPLRMTPISGNAEIVTGPCPSPAFPSCARIDGDVNDTHWNLR